MSISFDTSCEHLRRSIHITKHRHIHVCHINSIDDVVKQVGLLKTYNCPVDIIIPYFGLSRFDRSEDQKQAPYLDALDLLLSVKDTRYFIFDAHTKGHQPNENRIFYIDSTHLMKNVLREHLTPSTLLISPDQGGKARIQKLSHILNIPYVSLLKKRIDNKISFSLFPTKNRMSLQGKNIILIDDLFDSGQTCEESISFLKEKGVKNVIVYITHILNPSTLKIFLENDRIDFFITADTLFQPITHQKIKTIECLPFLIKQLILMTSAYSAPQQNLD